MAKFPLNEEVREEQEEEEGRTDGEEVKTEGFDKHRLQDEGEATTRRRISLVFLYARGELGTWSPVCVQFSRSGGVGLQCPARTHMSAVVSDISSMQYDMNTTQGLEGFVTQNAMSIGDQADEQRGCRFGGSTK